MFAVAVRYLTGRAVAKRFDSHDDPEWPPHPARLFSALVAALHAGGNQENERSALQWLEVQQPPSLWFSDWDERAPYKSYAPVNDAVAAKRLPKRPITSDDLGVLPQHRSRQERTFPSLTPHRPEVYFIWQSLSPEQTPAALRTLIGRVSYLGHSSSLVALSISDRPPEPRISPSPGGTWGTLRVTGPGHLKALEETFAAYASTLVETKGSAPRLPLPTIFQRYTHAQHGEDLPLPEGLLGEIHALRFPAGCRLGLRGTLMVSDALRKAAMGKSDRSPVEVLSGHASDGSPSQRPHVAFVPLADIGHPYADGHLLGVGAVPPRELDAADRASVLRALAQVTTLTLGRAGAWRLASVKANERRSALDPATWSSPARRWATVTPVVLDRFPRELYSTQAEEIVAQACLRAGFPKPVEVIIAPVSPVLGVPPSRDFPPYAKLGKPPRFHTHAIICFESVVRGPMLIGAGRYKGYGLCKPL